MYRPGELVEVREYSLNTTTTNESDAWTESWVPAIIIEWHGLTKMRTGLTRFETINVVSVLINGKIRKLPTRNIRYPRG